MKLVAVVAGLIFASWSSQVAMPPQPGPEPLVEPAPAAAPPTEATIPQEEWEGFLARAAPRFVPLVAADQVVALRLFMGPRSSLRDLGLKGGETVTAINGHSLEGDANALATFERELQTSRQSCLLSLTFQHRDQPRTVRAACASRPSTLFL